MESALWECSLFEEHGFTDLKLSVKHHDPVVMIAAYRQLAERCDYPLHLGVTEAGPPFQGTIKSAVAFGVLLAEGIGDTIRVSLSAPPVEEVKVGAAILESLGLRPRRLEIVSCPSCGRAQVDVYKLAEQVTAAFDGFEIPLRVAVMGCVVNGPGRGAGGRPRGVVGQRQGADLRARARWSGRCRRARSSRRCSRRRSRGTGDGRIENHMNLYVTGLLWVVGVAVHRGAGLAYLVRRIGATEGAVENNDVAGQVFTLVGGYRRCCSRSC